MMVCRPLGLGTTGLLHRLKKLLQEVALGKGVGTG